MNSSLEAIGLAGPSARWRNRFLTLGASFFTELSPQALPDPHWVALSADCARTLGLPEDWHHRPGWNALAVFSGNTRWDGMHPLASVYSGHQFGVWAGQLGDGRAHLLGELDTPGGPMEIQLKGSGRTPYSRMGDGRAVLRSSIREFLCSEAMHGLGVPTTRALCVTGSPLPVQREEIETAAIVTRVAPSFIRFGHFEHFAYHGHGDSLRQLCDFVIEHHYPQCRDAVHPYAALLEAVALRTAETVAQWQALGFCHGVLNTDNMSILGLTIDYGPFGFLDAYDPGHICNHSDHQGRYAYERQPDICFWNLHALGQAMLPLIGDTDEALASLQAFRTTFYKTLDVRMSAKIGLRTVENTDRDLILELLRGMAADKSDFTLTFRRLSSFSTAPGAANESIREMFMDRDAFGAWARRYTERLRRENSVDAERALAMNKVNPRLVLRNHLAEMAIRDAKTGDFSRIDRLLQTLSHPFDEEPGNHADSHEYAELPPPWAQSIEVSCSS